MKQLLTWCFIAYIGIILYTLFYAFGIWSIIISLALVTVPILSILIVVRLIGKLLDKREKEIGKYLKECDEKLKKGEISKEENTQAHFYWECGHNFA